MPSEHTDGAAPKPKCLKKLTENGQKTFIPQNAFCFDITGGLALIIKDRKSKDLVFDRKHCRPGRPCKKNYFNFDGCTSPRSSLVEPGHVLSAVCCRSHC